MWIGPGQLITALVLTGIAGGVMALGWALIGGFWNSTVDNVFDLIRYMGKRGLRPHPELTIRNQRARSMPYAPAIAIGTVVSFFAR
jgi:prepilin peptidase CpaA